MCTAAELMKVIMELHNHAKILCCHQHKFFLVNFLFNGKVSWKLQFSGKRLRRGAKLKKKTPLKIKFYHQDSINLPVKTFIKAWNWDCFDFGPTFAHLYLLKYVNFKIQKSIFSHT